MLLTMTVALGASAGCSHHRGNVKEPTGETYTTSSGATSPSVSSGAVQVTRPVRIACNLPDQPSEAPRFGFDSIDLRQRGENILHQVGVCLTTGPLAGKKVCITGYTDPRGTAAYNYDLGLARGYATMHYLEKFGVKPEQTLVGSRGASEARGTDEAGWAKDRRVEVDLAENGSCGMHRP
jgi:peptidoglycan-associated lipoprotein